MSAPNDSTPASATQADHGARRDGARLALQHYENFPILSRFVPPELRAPFAAVYAFARITDDLGDEIGASREARLAALDRWEADFESDLAGSDPGETGERDPVLVAVARTIRAHDLPVESFRALILANRMDQARTRYPTYAELLGYCALSANPVGRIVLSLLGSRDGAHAAAADTICTGLQLANHWQGIGEDLRLRDRLYVPLEDLARFGVEEAQLRRDRPSRAVRRMVGYLLDRTRVLFEQGERLPEAFAPRPAAVLRLFLRGGLAILDEIEARPEELLRSRIRVSRRKALLMLATEELRLAASSLAGGDGR